MSKKFNNSFQYLQSVENINEDLLTLTYGALIVRLIKDYEKPEEINEQLDKMGYNIGIRLIDDYLAKSRNPPAENFKEAVEVICLALDYYLKAKCNQPEPIQNKEIGNNNISTPIEYSIVFFYNPLNNYVELPEKYKGLWYSNIICGAIRGALEAINIRVECKFNKDVLRDHDKNEIRIKLIEIIEEKLAEEEQ